MAGGGPRRPHPPPSQPAVARVTPMVPEVSLFFPSQPKPGNGKSPLWPQGDPRGRVPLGDFSKTNLPINESSNPRSNGFTGNPSKPAQRAFNHPSNPTQRALNNPFDLGHTTFNHSSNPAPRAFNNLNQIHKPLNLPSNPSPTPSAVNSPAAAPAPHRAPTPTQFKPQSDFSRMFAGVDMTCLVPGEPRSGGRQQGLSRPAPVSGKGGFMVANGSSDDTQMFNVLEKLVGQGSQDRSHELVGQGSQDRSEEDDGRWINSSGELERGDSTNGWRERNEDQSSCNANVPQRQNVGSNNNENVNTALKSQYNLRQKQDYPLKEIVYPYQNQNEKQKPLDIDNQVGNFNNVRNVNRNVQFTPNDRKDGRNYSTNVNQNLQFTPNPNGPDDGSNAMMINRMPQQNLSNPNDDIRTHSLGTQSTPDLKSPPHTNLASHSQPTLVSQSNPAHPQASPLPPDLIQVLSWQNDQLRQLQKQVEILLQSPARRLETPTTTPTQTPKATCTTSTMTSMVWPDLEAAMAKLAAATDTPEHPTVEEINNSSVSTSPQPSLHLDLPDYTPSEVSPQTGGGRRGKAMVDIKDMDSPVLGESVSMYESSGEAENPQEMYNNILGQVRRMLDIDGDPLSPIAEQSTTATETSTQHSSTQPSRSQPKIPTPQLPPTTPVLPTRHTLPSPAVDPATATLERLRSLGISFISPADLTPATAAQGTGNKYNSVYLPTAASPSMSIFQGASPDTSLDINSLALKYLDDSQLTRLAEKHSGSENEEQISVNKDRPEKEDSGNNLSMATHQFLNRYGLGDQTNSEKYSSLPPKIAKPRGNGYLDVIQETQPSHNSRDRQLLNQAYAPQNQVNHIQISPQNNVLQQQSPHLPQHQSHQPQRQHSPLVQQVQPHQFQQQSPLLQREPQNQRFQHEHMHRFQQQQSPNFQQLQSPHILQQQTPHLLPQQVLQLQQRGTQQHSPRLRQQIPVHLQPGSNVNIPNRILDITAIRQQPKLL